jgi:probable phosphoglycerate mutase
MLHAALLSLLLAEAPALGPVPADAVRVFLVRHGQAYSNLDPEPDLPPEQLDRLTDLGREQSQAAARFLKGRGVVAVLTSPAGRAHETAEELRKSLGLGEASIEARIRPLDLGRAPDGAPLDWDQRISDWEAGRDPSPPGGESLEQLGQRALELVRSLQPGHAGKSVVLVAHSEVIGAFIGALEGTPGASRWPPKVPNGSLTVVDVGPAGPPRLLLAGQVPKAASRPR